MKLIVAAAIVGLVVTFPALWQQSAAEPSGVPAPGFVVHARGVAGEPVPLGLRIEPAGDDAAVIVTGLMPGMTLSTGNALGPNMWQVLATELAYTWIAPPKDFVGLVDLIAELRLSDASVTHRQPIQIEWIAESRAVAAPVPVATPEAVPASESRAVAAQVPAATPEPVPALQQTERNGAKTDEKHVASKVTAPPSNKLPATKRSRSEPVKKAPELIGYGSMDVAAASGNKVPQEAADELSPEHARQNQCDYQGCARAYRSFRASDCTYQPYEGQRRLCENDARPTEVPKGASQVSTQTGNQQCEADVCARLYRSFDPSDCTYQPNSGGARRICGAGKMSALPPLQPHEKADLVTEKAKARIAEMLENPASAEFGGIRRAKKELRGESLDTICGYVKAKSASGADTREMPFLYIVPDEPYLVDGNNLSAESVHRVLCREGF